MEATRARRRTPAIPRDRSVEESQRLAEDGGLQERKATSEPTAARRLTEKGRDACSQGAELRGNINPTIAARALAAIWPHAVGTAIAITAPALNGHITRMHAYHREFHCPLVPPERILWMVPHHLGPYVATAGHENGCLSTRGLSKSEGAPTSCRQQHQ